MRTNLTSSFSVFSLQGPLSVLTLTCSSFSVSRVKGQWFLAKTTMSFNTDLLLPHLLDQQEMIDELWEHDLMKKAKSLAAETEVKLKYLAVKKRLVLPQY